MRIRSSKPSDLPETKALTEACAVAMQERDIFQWNEHYPSLQRLKEDDAREELFVLEENEQILGIIVITDFMDDEYIPVSWLTGSSKNIYIHRLAVHPSVWGNGYARKLMDFAEDFARNNRYASVRLDTYSKNKRNQKFYELRGYVKLEDIYFPKQSEFPFHCYELVL